MRILLIAATFVVAAAVSPASADCTCRARGVVVHHGQTACIPTPAGPRLARCEMVSNMSSWKFLEEACPQASNGDSSEIADARSVAPVGHVILR